MMTLTFGRMPASSHASSELSTASLTVVSSALRGLSNPSRWRFLAKNSETEISFCLAAIDSAVSRRIFFLAATGIARFSPRGSTVVSIARALFDISASLPKRESAGVIGTAGRFPPALVLGDCMGFFATVSTPPARLCRVEDFSHDRRQNVALLRVVGREDHDDHLPSIGHFNVRGVVTGSARPAGFGMKFGLRRKGHRAEAVRLIVRPFALAGHVAVEQLHHLLRSLLSDGFAKDDLAEQTRGRVSRELVAIGIVRAEEKFVAPVWAFDEGLLTGVDTG